MNSPEPLSIARPAPERADAARNRRRILDAAQRILESEGVDGLAMDRVAAAAGVGIGTIYRRFGDRAGLAQALMDHGEKEFQAVFLSGEPPMGPGAPPGERIRAFLHTYIERLESQAALLAVAESASPTARYEGAAYAVHQTHLAGLIRQLDPAADADYLADALLAPLAAGLVTHQRGRGYSIERITAGLDRLLAALTGTR